MKGFIVSLALCCCALPIISPLHSGGTDGAGGHYDHSTGEYHYHHGYPAHQHPNGECPYAVQEEDFDCGKEGCDIKGQHGHINKPKTTTTTTTTTTSRTQKQEKDSEHKDSSADWIIDIGFILFIVIIIICCNLDNIKAFISKRLKKGKQ
jgi:hypothetical protein